MTKNWIIESITSFQRIYNSLITTEYLKFLKDMSFGEEREMHTATCGDCGNECQVPFKPKEDRPVYCRECFPNHRPQRRSGDRFGGRSRFNRQVCLL